MSLRARISLGALSSGGREIYQDPAPTGGTYWVQMQNSATHGVAPRSPSTMRLPIRTASTPESLQIPGGTGHYSRPISSLTHSETNSSRLPRSLPGERKARSLSLPAGSWPLAALGPRDSRSGGPHTGLGGRGSRWESRSLRIRLRLRRSGGNGLSRIRRTRGNASVCYLRYRWSGLPNRRLDIKPELHQPLFLAV